jgi:hypothetical protein
MCCHIDRSNCVLHFLQEAKRVILDQNLCVLPQKILRDCNTEIYMSQRIFPFDFFRFMT